MTPITDTERLGWQFRALALLSELVDRAIAEHLPPLQWSIGTTGELRGQVGGYGDRREAFTRWRDAIGNPDREWEVFEGKRLRAAWDRLEHVEFILAADLPDDDDGLGAP
jgi:hypothetical protein